MIFALFFFLTHTCMPYAFETFIARSRPRNYLEACALLYTESTVEVKTHVNGTMDRLVGNKCMTHSAC